MAGKVLQGGRLGREASSGEESDARYDTGSFVCPYADCNVHAEQRWGDAFSHMQYPSDVVQVPWGNWSVSQCMACSKPAFWYGKVLIIPFEGLTGPAPHESMPEAVARLYDEARGVAQASPRSASALLRLALQVLMDELVDSKEGLDSKIGKLVARGLHPDVQKAMDVLRIVGNNAVHPGEINLEADGQLVPGLFSLLNLVVEQIIERPQRVQDLYASLPEGALAHIANRDSA